MFFSMLFWAFFEQAGSSVNNFTDRNVDRVIEVARGHAGGRRHVDRDARARCRPSDPRARRATAAHAGAARTAKWRRRAVHADRPRRAARDGNRRCGPRSTDDRAGRWLRATSAWASAVPEIPASLFQAANPIFILALRPPRSRRCGRSLAARGLEPSTPVKFALGLLQLGLGFGASGTERRWPTSAAWSRSAGCCSAICSRRPASCASRPSGFRWSPSSRRRASSAP